VTLPYAPPEMWVAAASVLLLAVSAAAFALLRWMGRAVDAATALPAGGLS